MTTAARPTFEPARGGSGRAESDLGALSKQYSSRDLPSHTKLKYRQDGQSSSGDLKSRNFRRDLESREHAARERRGDRDGGSSSKRARTEHAPANVDADEPVEDYDEDEDSDDEDDDNDLALAAELAKIRKERTQEAMAKEAERKAEEERIRMDNIVRGNPLLNQDRYGGGPAAGGSKDFKVKRRWDDDVVFKNCARVEDDKAHSEFINDTLRSEFHKKFMSKYIK